MRKHPLKLGVIQNGTTLPIWVFETLQTLIIEHIVQLEHCIILSGSNKPTNSFLYNLCLKYERRRFKFMPNAHAPKNIDALNFNNVVFLDAKDLNNQDKLEKSLKQSNVDLFLDLRFQESSVSFNKFSKHGTIIPRVGSYKMKFGNPPGVWELLDDWDATGVQLEANCTEFNSRIKLDFAHVYKDSASILRNQNNLYWCAKSLIVKHLKKIQQYGFEDYLKFNTKIEAVKLNTNTKYAQAPNNIQTLKGFLKLQWRGLKRVIERKSKFEQWQLLYNFNSENAISTEFLNYTKLLPPTDRFWADPFPIYKNGKYYIFFEELVYKENKGRILVMAIDENGNCSQPKVALETDYHLSYPFLIEEGNDLYMIPETEQSKRIELYKCVTFPDKWQLDSVLFEDFPCVDTTIYKHNNTYYLFTSKVAYYETSFYYDLHLYYSDDLKSNNWTAHPNNPIASNPEYARSAGALYTENNKLIRPAQNCSKRYGYGLQLREITKLSKTEYKEHCIKEIHPEWHKDVRGIHTINKYNQLTVIDAIIKRRKK